MNLINKNSSTTSQEPKQKKTKKKDKKKKQDSIPDEKETLNVTEVITNEN